MKVGIKSFFFDYYDLHFESAYFADEVWERYGNLPPYKDEAFSVMEEAGLLVPRHGTAASLREQDVDEKAFVVAYYDPTMHTSCGKYRTRLERVYYDNMYCSEFIDTPMPPQSTRYLWCGERCFSYTLTSDHEWMSNTGNDFEISDVKEMNAYRHFNYPLYAVDFVGNYAVDLNRCPSVKGTGIEELITGKECADLIISWVQRYDFEGNLR